MRTPIVDFIRNYREKDTVCFHMPGHKGRPFLGVEPWDITEVSGADSLYEADGIIAESEANAAALFGTQGTFYSTEGSSQCIRAMLYLALTNRKPGTPPLIVAARNVHKSFVYAAALLDFEVCWLWPKENNSICSCTVSTSDLEDTLRNLSAPPAAVYITSPDYLGQMADIRGLAEVCHRHGTILAVDNAHGAYLHFLDTPQHPLDMGADLCCDSAHKTLPVLTGGAYLHISRGLPSLYCEKAKSALALFGSTSPSYVILASLDACNQYLSDGYSQRLKRWIERVEDVKATLRARGWNVAESDPLKLTIRRTDGYSGRSLAEALRSCGMECEYADRDYLVLMLTPENSRLELDRLLEVLETIRPLPARMPALPLPYTEQVVSIRRAIMGESERIKVGEAIGRICSSPLVSCPPAIPIVISGERVTEKAVALFRYYEVEYMDVLKS